MHEHHPNTAQPTFPNSLQRSQQGISWLLRKAASVATLEIIMATIQGDPFDSIKVLQIIRPGKFETAEETHICDGEARESTVPNLGRVTNQTRYLAPANIPDEELRTRVVAGAEGSEVLEHVLLGLDKGWEVYSVQSFEVLEGLRRCVRYSLAKTKGGERHLIKVVYDFLRENK